MQPVQDILMMPRTAIGTVSPVSDSVAVIAGRGAGAHPQSNAANMGSGSRGSWLRCAMRRMGLVLALVGLWLTATLLPAQAADPVRGEAALTKPGNYARLLIKLNTDVPAEVRLAGTILIVQFRKPVDISVDKLADAVPDYVGSARLDPDGTAIRLALTRKVTPNMMAAGERLFVDLLPENWSGAPPGLPAQVVRELAERARAAEQALRRQQEAAQAEKLPPIRVKASRQPTFMRYVFDISRGLKVSSILGAGKLTLSFTPAANFDLADALVAASTNVVIIKQTTENDTTMVTFELVGEVDVHTFREEKTYVVDIGFEPDKADAILTEPPREPASLPLNNATVQAAPASEPAAVKPGAPNASRQSSAEAARPDEDAAPEAVVKADPAQAPQAAAKPAADAAGGTGDPAPPTKPAWSPEPAQPNGIGVVQARRVTGRLRLVIPFAAPATGAVFSRDDAIWLAFAGDLPLDVGQLVKDSGGLISEASSMGLSGGRAIRLRLIRPQLIGVSGDNSNWVVDFTDAADEAPRALSVMRSINDSGRGTITVPLAGAGRLLKLTDPDNGDNLMIVTAALPAQGFAKRQSFVDVSFLPSVQGVVAQPNSDDLRIDIGTDIVTVSRPGGLTLSPADKAAEQRSDLSATLFDLARWKSDREANFGEQRDALVTAAAMAIGDGRVRAHIDLARFYFAHQLYPEAKGVIDALFAESKPTADDALPLALHAAATIMRGDPARGRAELADPIIGAKYDAPLWKAVADARLGNWIEARELFKGAQAAIGGLPTELQRLVTMDELRAASELRDYAGVSAGLSELDSLGVPQELQPQLALIRGRMDEALGKESDALAEYRIAAQSADRIAASAARDDEIALKQKRNEISSDEALTALETLAMTWRGDMTEIRNLQLLARLYVTLGRYRDALMAARTATKVQANSAISRQLQDDAAGLFTEIFLGSRGDDLPPVQAVALFYEFSELTPIGRRGDELIRRLAERLVAVDLLDQAGELLQYQIDKRLDGAARAQVAARLAMIYLMNRKPDRAIGVLRSSRVSDLAGELRAQRLLIEARAQSDIGRPDLALDIIANLSGREVLRLRSDIYWAGRRWRESAEQIELMYGNRWQDFQPLSADERGDIVRAAIGYSLAEDGIGLARLRDKYAAKMDGDDKAAFDAVASPTPASSAAFATVARMAARVDTLSGFVRDMKTRFPDTMARAPVKDDHAEADPSPTGALPKIMGLRPAAPAQAAVH